MIFGNPGIYLGDGSYDDFSIIVEELTDEIYSVNFCVDMELFPTHLAYNGIQWIFEAFKDKDIFKKQSKELFELDDRDLMIALIKESFVSLYRVEEIVDLNLQPKFYTDEEFDRYDLLFDSLYDPSIEVYENRDKIWDFDGMEYSNRGYNVFVVNYNDESKIVLVQQKRHYGRDEYERYFYKDKTPKRTGFFDENYWSVKVATLATEKILSINSQILSKFLPSYKN